MMSKTIALAALMACLAAGSAQATCIYPRAPEHIPDGKTASYDEMVAGQKAVKQFDADMTAYNACLDMETASLEQSGLYDENRLVELRAMQAKKNNAAVDEVQAVADRFNEQLRIFKARDKQD
jgi:opacity protein-like surface antigen